MVPEGRTRYVSCPVCDNFGPFTIDHIKQCAQKRQIDPKTVLQLVKNCQKWVKPSFSSSQANKSQNQTKAKKNVKQKCSNNYVINFEPEKGLSLAISAALTTDERKFTKLKSKCNKSVLDLSINSINVRKAILETRVNEEVINNVANNYTKANDDECEDHNSLPNSWKLASLPSGFDNYVLRGFDAYFSK